MLLSVHSMKRKGARQEGYFLSELLERMCYHYDKRKQINLSLDRSVSLDILPVEVLAV